MPSTQEINRRIKSIKSTKKITRAMQMVSAAKMRKAQNATLASRDYASLASGLITELSSQARHEHPLLHTFPTAKKIGIVVVSTNRGLVGSFNTNLLQTVRKSTQDSELLAELIVVGKKAKEGATRARFNITAEFHKYDTTIPVSEIYPLAALITEQYKTGQYKEILVVYNHFISTLVQTPTIKRLLPFAPLDEEPTNHHGGENIIFEPNPAHILNQLIPRIIESQLYQAVLESDASEHSARMVMMKNATEAAGDLISDLTLTYNQLRQNKITTELSEITAGKIALENK
jgi:F-type H+-transporting ATPase subunit gamma